MKHRVQCGRRAKEMALLRALTTWQPLLVEKRIKIFRL